MLRKFVFYFAKLILSFFVSNVLGWTEPAIAFFIMDIGIAIIGIIVTLAPTVHDVSSGNTDEAFQLVLYSIIAFAIMFLASFGANKLFSVDFYVAYLLICFGLCFWQNEHF